MDWVPSGVARLFCRGEKFTYFLIFIRPGQERIQTFPLRSAFNTDVFFFKWKRRK